MENQLTTWSKEEFLAYLLIYCMDANFVEDPLEIEFIKKKVGSEIFENIHNELDADNDYQSLQKIQSTFKRFHYGPKDKERLLKEIQELFGVDGCVDQLEKNMYLWMGKLLD